MNVGYCTRPTHSSISLATILKGRSCLGFVVAALHASEEDRLEEVEAEARWCAKGVASCCWEP